MIVSPTLCYPSHRQEVKNEWFRTESPVAEGAEKDWFQPPTAVEGIVTSLKTLTSRCINQIFYIDEDVFEMEDAEIDGINLLMQTTEVIPMYKACIYWNRYYSVSMLEYYIPVFLPQLNVALKFMSWLSLVVLEMLALTIALT